MQECTHSKSRITNSRHARFKGMSVIRRRRECRICNQRWTTLEVDEATLKEWHKSAEERLRAIMRERLIALEARTKARNLLAASPIPIEHNKEATE